MLKIKRFLNSRIVSFTGTARLLISRFLFLGQWLEIETYLIVDMYILLIRKLPKRTDVLSHKSFYHTGYAKVSMAEPDFKSKEIKSPFPFNVSVRKGMGRLKSLIKLFT